MVVKPLHKRANYRPVIQGLRGVAVLLVVLYHAGFPVYGGYIGVDVFFVISGFVIARGIEKKLQENTFSFRQFYTARFRRLLFVLADCPSMASGRRACVKSS